MDIPEYDRSDLDNPLILTPAFRSKLTPRPYPYFSYLFAA